MRITEVRATDAVNPIEQKAVAELLHDCFDGVHCGRTFFKQMPAARLLAWNKHGIVGHLGLEYRLVRAGQALLPILGIIDLCVTPGARGQGVGAALLDHAEHSAKAQSFGLAMADDTRLYERSGYHRLSTAHVTFLAIDELRCQSVVQRDLSDIFMVKPLIGKPWPQSRIDLLGYLF